MKNQLYFCALIIFFFQCCFGQTVRTIVPGNFDDGLAVDQNGDVYCFNYAGTEVFKFNYQTEQVTTFASGLGSPNGIGIGPNNEVYVCESLQVPSTGQGQIRIYNNQGVQTGQIANLFNPTNVQYRASDNTLIWVSYYGNTINLINLNTLANTVIATATTAPLLDGPSGIAFVNGETYISNFNNRKICKLNSDNSLSEIAQLPAGASTSNFLGFISSDSSHIYATKSEKQKSIKLTRLTVVL